MNGRIEELPEWERELLEEQYVEQQLVDRERLVLTHEIFVSEAWWVDGSGKNRITITLVEPKSIRWLLDEIRGQMSRIQRPPKSDSP